MSVHYGKAPRSSMSNVMLFLMLCKISLRRKLQTFPGKMVNTLHSDEEKGIQDKESLQLSRCFISGQIRAHLCRCSKNMLTDWRKTGGERKRPNLLSDELDLRRCDRRVASILHHFKQLRRCTSSFLYG
ncbi:protein TUNAR isoform X1 [Clinocottus analis]|uniref:protein TUNAR isoform X1 n=1 Tax=Clinocottus analis TaxID=304258 RepID=UPI0035C12389